MLLYWLYKDNGKENGNYFLEFLGLYSRNGKGNGIRISAAVLQSSWVPGDAAPG